MVKNNILKFGRVCHANDDQSNASYFENSLKLDPTRPKKDFRGV